MTRFVLKRLLMLVPLFFGITIVTFLVTELAPGDPTDALGELNPKMTVEVKHRLKERFGLDAPLGDRYVRWLRGAVRMDFGYSFKDGERVTAKILKRIPVTLGINLAALVLILTVAIPLGVRSAVREGTRFDRWVTVGVLAGFAMPSFWLALILMDFFGVRLGWLPVSGMASLDHELMSRPVRMWDTARHLILPVTVSALGGFAGISRFMRASMIEVLHEEYILTAVSKGLGEQTIFYKHAL
ncbi:MAG: ABC transporter permease, partial [Candidatus Omnitrophica bacterium]|nr:ABC transporter permease [Candidatus Omnitrophota bacterium]